jgi:hypothetical protein
MIQQIKSAPAPGLLQRIRVASPISTRALIVRRAGAMPTQAYRVRSSLPRFNWTTRNLTTQFPGSMAMVYRGEGELEGFFDIVKKVGGAVVGAVKGVFRDSTVTLPGGIEVPAKDLPRVVKGASVRFGKTPSPAEQFVEQVPGGLGTIAVVAAVGLGALLLMGGRGRR